MRGADFSDVSRLLMHMQSELGANLSAFEVIWNNAYRLIDEKVSHITVPLATEYAFYVLIESMGNNPDTDGEQFVSSLGSASEAGLVAEAIIADSDVKIANLWAVRDGAAEVMGIGFMHAYDVSLDIADMGYFGDEVERRLRASWPDAVIGLFGHIGDGNVHIIINVGPETQSLHLEIDTIFIS